MTAVSTNLRIFFVGGLISFRALFNWLKPSIYIPTMLGAPLFQILFFTYLGRYAKTGQSDAFFVVGNAVQVCGMSSVYGMTMAISNERVYGTLGPIIATPANRVAIFLGRGLPVLVNGLAVSLFGFLTGVAFLDFRPHGSSLPALALVVCVTTLSCTAFGMLLGSLGLQGKDFFFVANLAYFLMLLLCGVNVPLSVLPGWLAAIGRAMPLTHGIQAARRVASGEALGDVSGLIWTELGIAAAYAAAGFALFRLLETASRRTASLDAF